MGKIRTPSVVFMVVVPLILLYFAEYIIFSRLEILTNKKKPRSVAYTVFHAWNDGLVTSLKPETPRNCQKLFSGDFYEIKKQKGYMARWRNSFKDRDLLTATSNCSWVNGYFNNNLYVTTLERSFPIAFTFLIHNSPQQVVRLLRVLYRPHNQYCIAPDIKSSQEFQETFRNIAPCLDNVHIVSKARRVSWGHRSIIESQMQCYRDLMAIQSQLSELQKWKYVINLCGKELPLTSTHDIVSRLVKLNGTSVVNKDRVTDEATLRRLHKPIPYNITYYKSATYMSLSFQFINYRTTNSTAAMLLDFFARECDIAEEHYYPTLYMLPGIPGGFNSQLPKKPFFITSQYFWRLSRYIVRFSRQCSGRIVHNICVVDAGDMFRIEFGGNALFHNKYFMEKDHVIMDCMEEKIVAKNKMIYKWHHF